MLHRFVLVLGLLTACDRSNAIADATKVESDTDKKAAAAEVKFDPKLVDIDAAKAKAPDQYEVDFTTTKGNFRVRVHREWAPIGADRFYNLVAIGFYDGTSFFRVMTGFMAQFGVHGIPKVNDAWKVSRIADDPRTQANRKGRLSFANAGPNTRTTQVFINYNDHASLDTMGFAPFGEVVSGMDVVEKLHAEYGDGPPGGSGPDQHEMERKGADYLARRFPKLDRIESAKLVAP